MINCREEEGGPADQSDPTQDATAKDNSKDCQPFTR